MLKQSSLGILSQLDTFLSQLDPAPIYTLPSERVPGSTIGKHVRHLLDHFRKLIHKDLLAELKTSPHQAYSQSICYDIRVRNTLEETEIAEARKHIHDLQAMISEFPTGFETWPVRIEVMMTQEGHTSEPLHSSLGRELWFVVHHAIHHHAMIKVIAEEHGVPVRTDFGLAPSTANFRRDGELSANKV